MTISSVHQLNFFLLSALAGLTAGAFYNLLAAVREKNTGRLSTFITDLFFWIVVGAALIKLSLDFNDGGIRAYQILGMACGFCLHYLCLNRITLKIAQGIVTIIALLLFPAAFLLRGIMLYVKRIFENMNKTKVKIRQNVNRISSRGKMRKKIQKKYKKML